MRPEPWSRLEDYFHQLADLSPADQQRMLEQAFGDQPELRRQLESLLARDRDPMPFLDRPVAMVTAVDGQAGGETGLSGRTIGPYRLLRPIAYGGMGSVYLACGDNGSPHPPLAVKVLREVIEPDSLMRRYHAERQALAQLDHPNIARLLDAGMTEAGRPYLVMEYVDGLPIDAYCDRHRLPLRERLELFRTVCLAVHAAHRSLVVHRDLKPDNILVTEHGEPKLVDFGIARLIDPHGEPSRLATTTGGRLMTPQYASPEQVRGEPVTTATDVYSLGVVLFGLLTGERPYRLEGCSPGDVERQVCMVVPPRPSTVAGGRGAQQREAAANRRLGIDGLSRRLRGDLDNIVMMALRKEPQRRYASAAELAEDVRRHLAGLPVAARQDTAWYRTGKFILRNKVSTAIAAVLVLALSAGSVAIGWQAHVAVMQREAAEQARRQEQVQRSRAEAAEHEARTEAESARLVSDFLVDIFKLADPSVAPAESVTVRQILDEASARLSRDPQLAPEARATLELAVGRVSLNLGLYDRAGPLLDEARRVRTAVFGREAPQTQEVLEAVGELLYARGEYRQAQEIFEDLVTTRRRQAPSLELAEAINNLGAARKALGELDAAEALYREALDMRRALAGDADATVAESLNNLAGVHASRGEMDRARQLLADTLRIRRAALGDDHPLTAQTISNLATVARLQGDDETAEPLYREALDRFRAAYGDAHPAVATTASGLGALLQAKGNLAEAETYLRQALELRRRQLGDDHPALATSLTRLARVLQGEGDLAAARQMLEEAVRIRRVSLPADHADTASTLQAYGVLLLEAGEPEPAEAALREAESICRVALPAGHHFTAITRQSLANALVELGRFDEAEPLLLSAYESLEQQRGAQDADTRHIAGDLASLYDRTARPDQAREWRARQ